MYLHECNSLRIIEGEKVDKRLRKHIVLSHIEPGLVTHFIFRVHWLRHVAEVTVDLTSYTASIDDFVAVQEVGKVLHPVLARGQIAGGIAQGIGYTLYEKVIWQNGRMQNAQMTNYIMPTSADLPPIRVFFEEMGNIHGAFGAKGIGELPMDGPAPAILNAVEDAVKVRFNSIPLLPEDIFEALVGDREPRAAGGVR